MTRRLGLYIPLYIPWALFAFVCAGWTAYWFVAKDAALKALDAQIVRVDEAGLEARYDSVRASGYPLRLTLTLTDVRLENEKATWAVAIDDLAVSINLTNPRHIILGFGDMAWSRRGAHHTLSAKGAQASLRFLKDRSLARASLDVEDAHVAHHGASAPDTEIGKLLVHVRPDPRDRAAVQLAVDATDWRGPTPLADLNALAPYTHFRAAVVVTDSGTLASRRPLKSFKGRVRIERFDVASARGAFTGEGELTLDAARRPEGTLRLDAPPLTVVAAQGWWTLGGTRLTEARPLK